MQAKTTRILCALLLLGTLWGCSDDDDNANTANNNQNQTDASDDPQDSGDDDNNDGMDAGDDQPDADDPPEDVQDPPDSDDEPDMDEPDADDPPDMGEPDADEPETATLALTVTYEGASEGPLVIEVLLEGQPEPVAREVIDAPQYPQAFNAQELQPGPHTILAFIDADASGTDAAGDGDPTATVRLTLAAGQDAESTLTLRDGGPDDLDQVTSTIANEVCTALFRCCDEASIDRYFIGLTLNETLSEALRDRIPPNGDTDLAACPALLEEIYAELIFGPYIEAVRAGRVAFNAQGLDECIGELSNAACGAEITAALNDGTCLGLVPPPGGELQRRMFSRTATEGACSPIPDGVGGIFFGTCDPNTSFCCVPDPEDPALCAVGSPGAEGECRPSSQVGGPCGFNPSLQVCATGLECDADTCVEPDFTPLQEGDTCAEGFTLIGECQDSYCDLTGSNQCEPLKGNGESCFFPEECASGECLEQACTAPSFCVE